MNFQQAHEAFQRQVGFALFNAPILYTRHFIIIRKGFMAGIALLLTQLSQFFANLCQLLLEIRLVLHKRKFLLFYFE